MSDADDAEHIITELLELNVELLEALKRCMSAATPRARDQAWACGRAVIAKAEEMGDGRVTFPKNEEYVCPGKWVDGHFVPGPNKSAYEFKENMNWNLK